MELRTPSRRPPTYVITQCFPVLVAFLDHHMVQDDDINNADEVITTTLKPLSEKDKKLLELLQ
jgi:hypothetical protein